MNAHNMTVIVIAMRNEGNKARGRKRFAVGRGFLVRFKRERDGDRIGFDFDRFDTVTSFHLDRMTLFDYVFCVLRRDLPARVGHIGFSTASRQRRDRFRRRAIGIEEEGDIGRESRRGLGLSGLETVYDRIARARASWIPDI